MKIYVKASESVVASTRPRDVLTTCMRQYFPNLRGKHIFNAIRDAILEWKKITGDNSEYGFWFHHINGKPKDHRPENILIIEPNTHRKLHNVGDIRKEIAKSSGDLTGRFDANEAFDFDNIILDSMKNKEFIKNRTLAYIFETVIDPLISKFESSDYTEAEMKSITLEALEKSNIKRLNMDDINGYISKGFNTHPKMSTKRIDKETADTLISYLESLQSEYEKDSTKQPMHMYSLQYMKEFLEDPKNIVTREELYNEYLQNLWKHSDKKS